MLMAKLKGKGEVAMSEKSKATPSSTTTKKIKIIKLKDGSAGKNRYAPPSTNNENAQLKIVE